MQGKGALNTREPVFITPSNPHALSYTKRIRSSGFEAQPLLAFKPCVRGIDSVACLATTHVS